MVLEVRLSFAHGDGPDLPNIAHIYLLYWFFNWIGVAAVLVGHPFDLVKVRMQTGAVEGANASVFGIMRKTFLAEGLPGLYRGVSAPILAVSPVYALSFWGYDVGQRLVHMFRKDDDLTRPSSLLEISIAGGLSGNYI